jgi:hypothetical protein
MESLKNYDIIKWLNKYNFDLFSNDNIDIREYDCDLKIINKTIKLKKQNNLAENSIVPKTQNEMNNYYLQTGNNLSSNMKKKNKRSN